MTALTRYSGIAVLAIAVVAALALGLAFAGHGTCW